MTYLELEAYSEHCQTSTMECFTKNSYIAHFLAQARKSTPKKFLLFQEMELFGFNIKKIQEMVTLKKLLIFQEMELLSPSEKIFYTSGNGNPAKICYIFPKERFSYISGNGSPEFFYIFQEKEVSYISVNRTLLYLRK